MPQGREDAQGHRLTHQVGVHKALHALGIGVHLLLPQGNGTKDTQAPAEAS